MKFAAIILAVASVLAAFFQVGGRLAAYNLDALEGWVAAEFRRFNVEVEGIDGDWRYLDPVFRADTMRFQFGHFENVEIEVDLISTLIHDRLIARRFAFSDAQVGLENTPDGWRLKNQGEVLIDFDYVAFARSAGRMSGRMMVAFHDGDVVDHLLIQGVANNEDRHRFDVRLSTQTSCPTCGARVIGDLAAVGPLDGAIRVVIDDLALDHHALAEGLLLAGGGSISARAGSFDAALDLGLDAPDAEPLTTKILAAGDVDSFQGKVVDTQFGLETFLDSEPGFAWRGGRWLVWLPDIQLEEASAVALDLLGEDHELAEWISGLAPRGVLRQPMAVMDSSVAFSAVVELDSISAYRGVPAAAATRVRLAGGTDVIRAVIDDGPRKLDFPLVFPSSWAVDGVSGEMVVFREPGYLGIRGTSLTATLPDSYVRGGYALARPVDRREVRVTIDGSVVRGTVATGREFIPLGLGPDLERWLRSSLLAGDIKDGRVIYHGHGQKTEGAVSRQFEMRADLSDGVVRYHEDWPEAQAVDGRVLVTTAGTFASGSARSFDTVVDDLQLEVLPRTNLAAVSFTGVSDVTTLLSFVRATPLEEQLSFVHPTWRGEGEVGLAVDLAIALAPTADEQARYAVDFDLRQTALDLADFALEFSALDGLVSYASPETITSEKLTGKLFDRPVTVVFHAEERSVVDIAGAMSHERIFEVMATEDLGLLRGVAEFEATLALLGRGDPTLTVESDLVGMEIDLPLPLGKTAAASVNFAATMAFLPDLTAVGLQLDDSSGWLHFIDGAIARGSIGAGARPEVADLSGSRVELTGAIAELDLAEAMTQAATFDWRFRDLKVERIHMGDFSIDDATLNGVSGFGVTDFEIAAKELDGFVRRTGSEPWRLHLTNVRLPDDGVDDESAVDPIDVGMVADWVDVDVVVDDVKIGAEDYGQWAFKLRKRPDGVELLDVAGSIRGLTIQAVEPVFWDTRNDLTYFRGNVTATDVGPVMEAWDFVPSAMSERFMACGDIVWPGSPVWFEFDNLSGRTFVEINDGRLQDIEQGAGATKLLSLVNFSTVTKRLNFDFSDVFGDGISFDYATADVSLDDGMALFVEPVLIAGPGARININGTVDLTSSVLDNEMIVTLPIRQSLPWYAAALLPVTPTGAAGVLLGRRLFREQIEALSSVKYTVQGTYDEPEVELVEMFTNTLADESVNEEESHAIGCRTILAGSS